ncbi:MAG: carbon-nitrogen hydrolase family protein [Pseudomonadota bacterium]
MGPENANRFRAALVQLRAGRVIADNLVKAEVLIRQAADGGADYIQTPENTALMELEPERVLKQVQTEAESEPLALFRGLAKELRVWLHIGSIGVKANDGRVANRSYLLAPDGAVVARYDKLHMFDVDLPGGESYRESDNYSPGSQAVLVDFDPGGIAARLGMTICYDLRFTTLYHSLATAGANMIAIPAAFTKQTGEAHWHVLLRARAIETGAFVLAATQGGLHDNGRWTFGHSMIIAPWGEILAEAGVDPCVVLADIDLDRVEEVRARIPALSHGRAFEIDLVTCGGADEARQAS